MHSADDDSVNATMPAGTSRRDFLKYSGAVAAAAAVLPVFTAPSARAERPHRTRLVAPSEATTLWYTEPGRVEQIIQEGLPIGNGRIGALTTGDPAADTFYVTDSTLWTGGLNAALNSGGQFPYDAEHFGTLSLLAKLTVTIPGHTADAISGYRRELDLSNGLVKASYRQGGVTYSRHVYASHPDDVIVVHLSQDGGGAYTGRLQFAGTHGEASSAKGAVAQFGGALDNGLRYACLVTAASPDGSVSVDGSDVTFTDCSEVVVVLSGGTNYRPDPANGFQDPHVDPLSIAQQRAKVATHAKASHLLAAHVGDYRRLYDQLSLSLGTSSAARRAMDTPSRLMARATYSGGPDPELEASYLQFGRYLTITASRTSAPINLQGMWLDSNSPAWMSDYHTDINLEMNYWLTDRSALSECHGAFTDYCVSQVSSWTKTTHELFQDPRNGFRNSRGEVAGWTIAISENIYGGDGWWWHVAGSAWICNTLFAHYEYTQDRRFLRKIYPLIKGACQFWQARLLTTTVDGREVLIDDSDWSPEQGPTDAKGITYAQELVWQLFANLQTACTDLDHEPGYAATIKDLQSRLYLPQVSKTTGWLEEWMTDKDLGSPTHRHLSPLIGLFPGDRINTDTSPQWLLEGATKLLTARGMSTYGWGMAWRSLCWSRLKNATMAYRAVLTVMRPASSGGSTAINFFDMYAPRTFQIDANLGTPTAMLDMLLYSRPGVIELLPAAPAAWSDGSVTGLRARGGFLVDMTWTDRQITKAVIRCVGGSGSRETTVRFGTWDKQIRVAPGRSVTVRPPARKYHDEPDDTPYSIVNRAGMEVNDPGASTKPGTVLIQWGYSGAANALWRITDIGGGRLQFTNATSGLVAEVYGGVKTPGAYIDQWSNSGSTSQQWRLEDAGDGYVKIVNVRSGLLLSVRGSSTDYGAKLVQLADTGDPTQQWRILRT